MTGTADRVDGLLEISMAGHSIQLAIRVSPFERSWKFIRSPAWPLNV